jgi:hypothetical protein
LEFLAVEKVSYAATAAAKAGIESKLVIAALNSLRKKSSVSESRALGG